MTRKNVLKRQRCLRCHPDHIYPFQKFSCNWHKAQPSLARFVGFISFMLCILLQRHPRAPLSYWVWPPIYHLLLGLDSCECVLRNSTRSAFWIIKKEEETESWLFFGSSRPLLNVVSDIIKSQLSRSFQNQKGGGVSSHIQGNHSDAQNIERK